jgi:hypothetical protein
MVGLGSLPKSKKSLLTCHHQFYQRGANAGVSMARTLNLLGKRFHKLTVVKQEGRDKQGNRLWVCVCDCGSEVRVAGSKLKNGNTKSCGCAQKEAVAKTNKKKLRDLSGLILDRLTVIKRVGSNKSGNATWECSCSCGGIRIASSSYLTGPGSKSCGCVKKDIAKEMIIDIKGKRFNRLVAEEMVGFDKGRNALWRFKCDCNTIKVLPGKDVRSGHIKSCGCLQKENYEKSKNDVIGRRFGRLTVLFQAETKNNRLRYECLCDCGNITVVLGQNLVNSHTTSCGCYGRESLDRIHQDNIVHGMVDTPEYQSWLNMKARCDNPEAKGYHNYGGRGITYCEEWKEFKNFIEDMGPKPHPELTIERLDNNGPYSKNNCIWESRKTQANNRRDNIRITYEGETRTLTEWAREFNISKGALRTRIKNGWDIEEAFTKPVKKYKGENNAKS